MQQVLNLYCYNRKIENRRRKLALDPVNLIPLLISVVLLRLLIVPLHTYFKIAFPSMQLAAIDQSMQLAAIHVACRVQLIDTSASLFAKSIIACLMFMAWFPWQHLALLCFTSHLQNKIQAYLGIIGYDTMMLSNRHWSKLSKLGSKTETAGRGETEPSVESYFIQGDL